MVLSLGLPWTHTPFAPSVTGFQTAARVTAVAAAVLLLAALRCRRRELVLVAAGVALLGAFIGLDGGVGSGRMAHLLAVAVAVGGSGVSLRRA